VTTPRDYQAQALAARAAAQAERPEENRQAMVLATGLGKGNLIAWEAAAEPGRTLILAHTEEIVDQLHRRVQLLAPGRTAGIVKAERNDVDVEIIVGSVQTLANHARRGPLGDFDRLIVDECHHATAWSYQAVMRHWCALDYSGGGPGTPTTGYTATLERGDGASLGKVWHDVAFSRGISWAVRRGHLKPPRGYRVQVPGLTRAQDDAGQDRTIVDGVAPEAVVKEWQVRAKIISGTGDTDRPLWRSTVVFAPLVASARVFADAFIAAGVPAAVVWGDQDKRERAETIAAYNRGDILVLCNANALTEGFDAPRTSCVILPPGSRGRVIQRAGRGLRFDPESSIPREEQDCVLLFMGDGEANLNSVADLSDHPDLKAADGQSLTELEDEYNLNDFGPDAVNAYAGPLEVVQFDPLVAASSKAWGKTLGGALFLPAGPDNYVAVLPGYRVALVGRRGNGTMLARDIPDVELAMALAEDAAIDHGGDMGRLLADKSRAWRKGVPSDAAKDRARRLGLEKDLERIMASRSAGKAGKLSDVIDRVTASRVIDPVVSRVKERVGS
jgi:superfamily II DNA or RNA helicase